ncbi:hypothetical protein RI367_007485 [Sorochytrium milnesiophthora]
MGALVSQLWVSPLVTPKAPFVVFGDRHCFPHATTFIVKFRMSFKGGDFHVTDNGDRVVYRSAGRRNGVSNTVTMLDADDQPVLHIKTANTLQVCASGWHSITIVTLLDKDRTELCVEASPSWSEVYIAIVSPLNRRRLLAKAAFDVDNVFNHPMKLSVAPNVDTALIPRMGGSTSQYQNAPLGAPSTPLAVFAPTFCLSHAVTLTIKHTVTLSSSDLSVTDASGLLWFRGDGRSFSWSDKVLLYDADGQAVLNIERKRALWDGKYVMHVGESSREAVVTVATPLDWDASSNPIAVTLHDGSGIDLFVKGSKWSACASIFIGRPRNGGQLVARIVRNSGGFSTSKLSIEAAQNVDIALLVALAILFDEEMNKN